MTERATTVTSVPGSAQRTVRHLIVYVLLAVLVTITATGIAGLLERAFDPAAPFAGIDVGDLALSLAFAFIGGPLAAVLGWSVWRRLGDASERASLAWGLYLTVMYSVALVVAATALRSAAGGLVVGRLLSAEFAFAITWALVWAVHRRMLRDPRKRPERLTTVPVLVATAYGLVLGLVGAVGALGAVLDAAIRGADQVALAGAPWWQAPAQASVSLILGAAIWSWHWFRDGARHVATALADVVLVVVGLVVTAVVMLGGMAVALFVALRLLFDPGDATDSVLEPLGSAIAAAVVGALVWAYHRPIAEGRSDRTRRARRLAMSAIGLAATAAGIGVVLNAVLAAFVSPLAVSGPRTLLLGGLSALVVGGPTWWLNWRPLRAVDPDEVVDPGRRVYLVAVFGVSALVALIALLVVGYRVFESVLEPATSGSLVDRIRAPLGLLVATALVFGYHFAVWRHDRGVIAALAPAGAHRIGRIILVVPWDEPALERRIARETGARVTVWRRADADREPTPEATAVVAALDGVAARNVLVLAGPGDRLEIVPLSDESPVRVRP